MVIRREIGQRLTATVPRILATILNETIVAGIVVLLYRCRTARLVRCRALAHFSRNRIAAPAHQSELCIPQSAGQWNSRLQLAGGIATVFSADLNKGTD